MVSAVKFLLSRAERRSPLPPAEPARAAVAVLVDLTYELLDAHADTARLAGDAASDAEWQSHLAYLRDLQRVGRETLALTVAVDGDRPPATASRAIRSRLWAR